MTEYDMSSNNGNRRIIDTLGEIRGDRDYPNIEALSREDFLKEADRIGDVLFTCPGGVTTLAVCGFDDLRRAFNRLLTLANEAK